MANPSSSDLRAPEDTWLGQEIHDLIGHKLSLMVLHAGELELAGGPAAERAALIRETGHSAILVLQEILTRMAAGDIPAQRVTDESPLAALSELVAESRGAGLPVDLHATAEVDRLSPDTAELVRDVVREALTNVHKHAGVVPTTVTVEVLDDLLVIDVRNARPATRPATAAVGSRRGLRGMRHRLARHGGRLTHRTLPDGGYQLYVEVPS